VTPAELDAAKGQLVGRFPLTIETANDVAGAVSTARLLGLPADYLQMYRTRLAAVTAPQLQQVARTLVRPQEALVVVVGDGQKLYEKLRAIAPVRLVSATGEPMAPADLTPRAASLELDLGALAARRDSFVVRIQGNPLGYQTVAVEKAADGWTLAQKATIAGGAIQESMSLTTDARLAPRRLQSSGSVQGQATNTDVTYANGRAKGTASRPGPAGIQQVAVDAEFPAGTIDESALTALLPLLKWAPGAKFTFPAFSPRQGAAHPITLAVTGTEQVTVPAGTFEAYRVELTGAEAPLTYFVTTAAPYRVVRIAFAGQPIEMVLAK
jgi:hypothetical protein